MNDEHIRVCARHHQRRDRGAALLILHFVGERARFLGAVAPVLRVIDEADGHVVRLQLYGNKPGGNPNVTTHMRAVIASGKIPHIAK